MRSKGCPHTDVDTREIKRIEIISIEAVPCAPREIIDGTARALPPG